MSISAYDHPILSGLFGDAEVAGLFTAEADLAEMLRFEAALAQAQAAEGLIPAESAIAIAALCRTFQPDIPALARSTARDGVVVPGLVAQLRAKLAAPALSHLHRATTSQDLIDTSLISRAGVALAVLEHRLERLIESLDRVGARDGGRQVMGRTRLQRARPIAFGHKLAAWREPLVRHLYRLAELKPRVLVLQFGGAVGARDELADKAEAVADRLADALGLGRSPRAAHAERDGIGEIASWLSLVTGSLAKLGADVGVMAQNEVGEVRLASGGTSSAMPHKSNPVAAEILVTLGRFNAGLLGTLHQALVHENERSGAAWSLEWLTLPQMAVAAGAATRIAAGLIDGLELIGGADSAG